MREGCREQGLRIPVLFWMLRQMAKLFTKVGNMTAVMVVMVVGVRMAVVTAVVTDTSPAPSMTPIITVAFRAKD